jgi:rRNA methylases
MSLSKSKIKYIQSLKEKKYREEYNTFVAEGDKMVTDLLPVMSCELLVATPDFLQSRLAIIANVKEIIEVSKSDIDKASFLINPQQVIAVFERPQYTLNIDKIKDQLSLMLDGIQDPGNLGTIIRLADWYGIENIICSKDTVDVYNPKVVQATMGALARIKLHYTDLKETIEKLNNTPIYGTFLDGTDLYTTEISESGIIIMGNEGKGIRPEIAKCINKRLYIPNYPKGRETSESLNVAIATAIVCSEFRRRLS